MSLSMTPSLLVSIDLIRLQESPKCHSCWRIQRPIGSPSCAIACGDTDFHQNFIDTGGFMNVYPSCIFQYLDQNFFSAASFFSLVPPVTSPKKSS